MQIGYRPKDRMPELLDLLKGFITKVGNEKDKPSRLLGIGQAASYLGVEKQTMYKWVCQRSVPFVKCGRLTKFDPKELDRWIIKSTVKEIDVDIDFITDK